MRYLSYDKGDVFYYIIPKTGTRSIIRFLAGEDDFEKIKKSGKIRRRFVPNDKFRFTFIRNPLDRFISVYKEKILMRDKGYYFDFTSVDDLIVHAEIGEDRHLKPQHMMFNMNKIDFVGRFENFYADFKKMFATSEIKRWNRSRGNVQLTKGQVERIKDIYELDYQIFGY